MDQHEKYIREAVEIAAKNAGSGKGGPFGALVVRDGTVIGRGVNCVTGSNDPTAHAEVMAIRDACKNTASFKLEGASIYASCEPCPMCLSAIYWARISTVYFAADNEDASKAGFDDSFIYKEVRLPREQRSIPIKRIETDSASKPFDTWTSMTDRVDY
ncbi:MAG: nucleoside deaminase [Bacteroidales bacterium]|nr:nucleoside deaminase [Bacteroidales bacterium]